MAEWLMRPVKCAPGPLDTPCILWTGSTAGNGYGRLNWDGKTTGAHRVAFMLRHGHWPNVCRHRCDVRLCTNVDHLLDGTDADNMRDKVERGRAPRQRGESHGMAKLTEGAVRDIRRLNGEGLTLRHIAERFGISESNVCIIVARKAWAHVL